MNAVVPGRLWRSLACLAFALWGLSTLTAFGQTLAEPKANDPAKAESKAAADSIRQAYELSKTALTEADFTRIIELCLKGMAAGTPDDLSEYGQKLMSWSHNRRGQLRLDARQMDEALEDFDISVQLDGTRWQALHNRGYCYAVQQKYTEALADFNKTLELNSKYGKGYINRAEIHYAMGNLPLAMNDYTEALKLSPNDAEVLNLRGHAAQSLGKKSDARADYNLALQLNPGLVEALINRGELLQDEGNFVQAVSDFRRAVELASTNHRAYAAWAWLLATCPDDRYRDPQLAVRHARRALELLGSQTYPWRYRYLETLAAALASSGDYTAARTYQSDAISAAPISEQTGLQDRLKLYESNQPYRTARTASR